MADQITIDVETLQTHASAMRVIAGDIQEALSAVGSINLGGGAFGMMCAFLVPPAQLVTSVATSAIGSSMSMLSRTADEVVSVTAEIEQHEQDRVTAISAVGKGLE